MHKEPDEDIILGIRAGGARAERAICQLYDLMRAIIFGFVRKNMGTREEGLVLLQDAVVIVYEQIRTEKYVHNSKLSTYVYSVARHIWLNQLKRKKIETRILDSQPFEDVQESHLTTLLHSGQENDIKGIFQLLGRDCRQLLTFIIYENMAMKEVVEKMHYENEQVVRNKKYKCPKQLREIFATRPHLMSLFNTAKHG